MKNKIRIILTVLVLAVASFYIYSNRSHLSVLNNIEPYEIVILFLIKFIFFFLSGYTFKLIVQSMAVDLSIVETIGLSIITNFGNYLGPASPGAAIKAMYLKSTYKLQYAHFGSVMAINVFLSILITGIVSLISLVVINLYQIYVPIFLFALSIGCIVLSIIPFVIKLPQLKSSGRFKVIFKDAIDGFKIIRKQKRLLFFISIVVIFQFLWIALNIFLNFRFLGVNVTFPVALFIGAFTVMGNLITITNNNVGIQETISSMLFAAVGYDFNIGIIASGIDRIIHIVITFGLAPFFTHYIFKKEIPSLASITHWK